MEGLFTVENLMCSSRAACSGAALAQIILLDLLDLVFCLGSVITAVGMVKEIRVMIAAALLVLAPELS